MTIDSVRQAIADRAIRRSDARAVAAYASGAWIDGTLADTLARAASETPERVLILDRERRIDCRTLLAQSTALAHAMSSRAPAGSVISFMLPNWHEAAVIYLAATMAGMVVNPILPSLRDRELTFILRDADCRMIFIPATLRQYDY